MTSSLELNFDSKPDNNHIYSMLLKSVGEHSIDQKPQKIEEFVARLEEERLKIDAFKRELPLCMQLLNNAMEASRQQLQLQGINHGSRPVLEEFIPLKNNICSTEAQDYLSADKANWMTSAQLWNPETHDTNDPQVTDVKLALNGNQIINGNGAFLPFSSKDRNSPSFPELALASSHKDQVEDMKHNSFDRIENTIRSGNSSIKEKEQYSGSPANNSQAQRKARRCWSPDLHRRFVNALHMLGGSQVATPKQIRELMKVDGLTNDEVKSHLQKYRLHTRRPSPSPHNPISTAPQLVVLGGIWVPPEYAAAAAHNGAQAAALYGAHATTTHHMSPNFSSVGPPSMTHDMYASITPQSASANHMHHQLQVYNRALMDQRNSLPAPEVPCASGEPSESIEDEKSDSGSWKADSCGENGAERKRVEGEENNASSIAVSLKF